MSEEPRKASEILLGLEDRLHKIEAKLNLYNLTLSMILGKVNSISTNSTPEEPIATDPSSADPVKIEAGFPLQAETNFPGTRRITRPNNMGNKAANANIEFKDYIAQRAADKAAGVIPVKQELSAAKTDNNFKDFLDKKKQSNVIDVKQERKIPVTQRVQDNNKKDVFMAEVVISNNGNQILKTKTNAMGKWQAQLPIGNYSVKITKMDAASQKKIESESEIVVPNSNSTVVLSTLVINRG